MNSVYYNNGVLSLNLDSYLNVFNAVKRELDLNEDDNRYDFAIEANIADEVFRLAKQELFPNQNLVTRFTLNNTIDNTIPNLFTLELTCISRVLKVKTVGITNELECIKKANEECCNQNDSELNYQISGNSLVINNINPSTVTAIEVISNGGNINYWFNQGWRILVQAVKANIYLNYFKSLEEHNACLNSYILLYQDLEKQTYALYDGKIKTNRGYW